MPSETKDSSLAQAARFLLGLVSFIGLCGWIYLTLAISGYLGFPKNAWDAIGLSYPYIYLMLTLYFCWATPSRRTLLTSGVILNLPILGVVIFAIIAFRFEAWFGIVVCLLFLVLWSYRVWQADHDVTQ